MSTLFEDHLRGHAAAIAGLGASQHAIAAAGQSIAACLQRGGKVLLCGNGAVPQMPNTSRPNWLAAT